MSAQKNVKQHLFIMIAIVLGFSTFMMGYSYSPFIEVGFSDEAKGIEPSTDADLEKQYQDLYKTEE